jgi:hypothetical protein
MNVMSAGSGRVRALLDRLAGTPAKRPTIVDFPPERVLGESFAQPAMRPRQDYFEVTVNELYLSLQRKWFRSYDPLVYTVVEFEHGTQWRAVPFVVGPQLVQSAATELGDAAGVVLTDTRVAGLHPFKGDRLALTVLLCELEQHDYMRGLLRGVERVARAVDMTGVLGPALRTAEAVMDSVDDILGFDSTQLLAGLRRELVPAGGIPSPSYFAMIAQPDVNLGRLWVNKGRLHEGQSATAATPYRGSDYTLVSLRASATRHDVDLLPFQSLWEQAKREANRSVNRQLWEQRGRASLFTLAEAIYDSPDLTLDQQKALILEYEERAILLRDGAQRRQNLGPVDRREIDSRPLSASILEL